MSRQHWFASLVCIAAIASGSAAWAETITQGATTDAFAYQGFNSVNPPYINDIFPTYLSSGTSSLVGHDTNTFLQFDLSGIDLTSKTLVSATLRLFAISSAGLPFGGNPSGASPVTHEVYAATSALSKPGLYWDARPSFSTDPLDAVDSAVQSDVNVEVLFDVKDLVQAWLDGSLTNFGFAIKQQAPNNSAIGVFASSSNATTANRPSLTIELAPVSSVPEPTSIALAIFSLPALVWFARRRLARA